MTKYAVISIFLFLPLFVMISSYFLSQIEFDPQAFSLCACSNWTVYASVFTISLFHGLWPANVQHWTLCIKCLWIADNKNKFIFSFTRSMDEKRNRVPCIKPSLFFQFKPFIESIDWLKLKWSRVKNECLLSMALGGVKFTLWTLCYLFLRSNDLNESENLQFYENRSLTFRALSLCRSLSFSLT